MILGTFPLTWQAQKYIRWEWRNMVTWEGKSDRAPPFLAPVLFCTWAMRPSFLQVLALHLLLFKPHSKMHEWALIQRRCSIIRAEDVHGEEWTSVWFVCLICLVQVFPVQVLGAQPGVEKISALSQGLSAERAAAVLVWTQQRSVPGQGRGQLTSGAGRLWTRFWDTTECSYGRLWVGGDFKTSGSWYQGLFKKATTLFHSYLLEAELVCNLTIFMIFY